MSNYTRKSIGVSKGLTIQGLEKVHGGRNSLPPIDPYEAQTAQQVGDGSTLFDKIVITETDIYARTQAGHWMRVRPHMHDQTDEDE